MTTSEGSSRAVAVKLSQRSTEATLREVLDRIAAAPGRLREILESRPEPLLSFGLDRTLVVANRAAERFFGYDLHELDGRPTDLLVPARLRQPEAPPMIVTHDLTTVELPGLRKDGRETPLSWTFGAVTGDVPIFVLIVRDRLELESALEALYESEERFRLLVDGVRDHAIFMLDPTGRVSTWNSGAQRIKGWSADEILGASYARFFTDEDRAAGVPAQNLALAAERGHHQTSGWRLRKDGSRFLVDATLWALRGSDGALRGFAKITYDTTERRAAQEAERRLLAAEAARQAAEATGERLRRLHQVALAMSRPTTPERVVTAVIEECLPELEAPAGLIYVLDEGAPALRLAGQTGHPDQLLRDYLSIPLAARVPIADAARAGTALFFADAEACAAGYPDLAEAIRVGGFEASAILPLVVGGRTLGVVAIRFRERRGFDDAARSHFLTVAELCAQALDRARLLAAATQARAEAEAASRAKDEFLAMLGHELRNPLAPITTAVQLMSMRGDEHTARERAVIERQLAHIGRLVDDLLDVARVTRGKLQLSRTNVELVDVLSRAVEMASPLFEQRQHHLAVTGEPGLRVHADASRLAQVVANLLTNAAKYTPAGGHIHLEARREGDTAVIRVRDDGEGIAPELLANVFDIFVQGHRTFDRSKGGLGLGLALVKNLVALHGGRVEAHSEGPGRGSEFVVRLPLLAEGVERVDPETTAPVARPPGHRRVLLVDDNRDSAELLAMALSGRGYEVVFELDGLAALARLGTFKPDAAILDLGLPVIDGFELARRIRAELPAPHPRLIALTGYGQDRDRQRSREAGFDDHLVKPTDVKTVIKAIEGR